MPRGTAKARPGEAALSHREKLRHLREILFANVVMAGEIPSPTFGEGRLVRFLRDRFTEAGLANISLDQGGNVAGVLPGREGGRSLLLVAHLDKIWAEGEDHTVTVGAGSMTGRGLADNSLGVAVLASLPLILEELGVEFDADLVLLGATRSFGRGDLGGMRFFLENAEGAFAAALCLEGIELGRLSHSCPGMARGEIAYTSPGRGDDGGVAEALAETAAALVRIDRREAPGGRVLIGSIEAGSGHGVPPRSGLLRFEARAREAGRVARIEREIARVVAAASEATGVPGALDVFARRLPGALATGHPLVRQARAVHAALGIESRAEPSVSELALLLGRGIPSLTLGITRGENRHTPEETIQLEPIFDGLAQIVSMLQFLDGLREGAPAS
jgi:tripeptide aminopeptidase